MPRAPLALRFPNQTGPGSPDSNVDRQDSPIGRIRPEAYRTRVSSEPMLTAPIGTPGTAGHYLVELGTNAVRRCRLQTGRRARTRAAASSRRPERQSSAPSTHTRSVVVIGGAAALVDNLRSPPPPTATSLPHKT